MSKSQQSRRGEGEAPAEPRSAAIELQAHQEEIFWRDELRRFGLCWARQKRKSSTLGAFMVRRGMEHSGRLGIFASASILLGTENIRKEVDVLNRTIDYARRLASAKGMQVTSVADGLDIDAICDLFEHSKMEFKIWHDRSTYSWSRVVAPNPDTAVGWTGDVCLDEFGRIPELKDVLEAVIPIMDNNPQFVLRLATTPPPDDTHYSFELMLPPQEEFPLNARGNWYRSQAGWMFHRFDQFDAAAAGIPCFHPETGARITPEEHRRLAFDKAAWDRNYGCRFIRGGTAAVSLASIHLAMERGAALGLANHTTEEIAA